MTDEQTELTEAEKKVLKIVVDRWEHFHFAIIFLCGLGRAIKWLVYLGIGVATLWSLIGHGGRSS